MSLLTASELKTLDHAFNGQPCFDLAAQVASPLFVNGGLDYSVGGQPFIPASGTSLPDTSLPDTRVAIVYPMTLPIPQTSTVTPAERRALSDPQRPRAARAMQRDRLEFERITLPPLSETESDAFFTWWRDTLFRGGAWFAAEWPLPRGFVTAVRKFREQPRWQFVAGGDWRLSALCEVRGRGELPLFTVPDSRVTEDLEDRITEDGELRFLN